MNKDLLKGKGRGHRRAMTGRGMRCTVRTSASAVTVEWDPFYGTWAVLGERRLGGYPGETPDQKKFGYRAGSDAAHRLSDAFE